ncbi:MAG: AEC family transporter [Aestuariivirga sp.]|uniref:AEC family transporter n=1 Tax=Aestuariivirga sp. TaxID=2650926 RepID=UPI0038D24AB1
MESILTTVLPVFGMIVLGYGFAKARIFDAAAGRGITLFVFNVAIPALLFKTVATMGPQQGAPWALWLAFFGGLAMTWVAAALVSRAVPSLDVSGGAAASMAAGFGNLALLGTPLALAHFGQQVAIPLGMILSIHAPVLWFTAMLHRALFQGSGSFSLSRTAKDLFRNLATNAIVLGLLAGSLWRFAGLGLHPVAGSMLEMLADASVPTALFALGVSLAGYSLKGSWSGMFTLIALKMVLMPILVFLMVRYVVSIPPLWAQVAVLFAAMPTGANAFVFSQRNEEAVAAVSGAITLGTALAALSASVLLYLMDAGMI